MVGAIEYPIAVLVTLKITIHKDLKAETIDTPAIQVEAVNDGQGPFSEYRFSFKSRECLVWSYHS